MYTFLTKRFKQLLKQLDSNNVAKNAESMKNCLTPKKSILILVLISLQKNQMKLSTGVGKTSWLSLKELNFSLVLLCILGVNFIDTYLLPRIL